MNMQMDGGYVGAVVITGLVIVFVALILLIAAVTVMGKIFGAVNAKKAEKPREITAAPTAHAPSPVNDTVIEEDDSEIIAVIAAAVAAMSEECGTPLRIRSIKRSRTNAWANAAVQENTCVF